MCHGIRGRDSPKSISEEVGMAVPVVGKEYFLAGPEMTQASGLGQESVKGAEMCLSSQEMRFGLIWRRKEMSGWAELFARWICPPEWGSSCCKSFLKNLWLTNVACACAVSKDFWGETFWSGP